MTDLRGLHLHVDAASGAAGDMMLGALLDLGVPIDVVEAALVAIGAGGRLRVAKVDKHGIAATDLKVDTSGELAGGGRHDHATDPPTRPSAENTLSLPVADLERLVEESTADQPARHPHTRPRLGDWVDVETPVSAPAVLDLRAHGHGAHAHAHASALAPHIHVHHVEHAHYHYADIRTRIVDAPLGDGTRRRALDIFDRIARAEARLHGTAVDDVAFHEVGAIDSVVDVVGTAAALDWLSPASVSCASVAMGHGTIHCAHGVLPVPAPAALEVLREAGGMMADGGVARELCTPTGAAILAATVTHWAPAPTGRPVAIGFGAGDADLADRANVLRVVVLAPATVAQPETPGALWQIDANVDDMSPELCAPALDAVFAAGAVDAWWTPITMKKGRPALTLSALVGDAQRAAVISAILRETTTIGVRYSQRERTVLERSHVEVTTRYGVVPIKVARDNGMIVNAAPEYEACATAARAHGVAVKVVYAAALAAYDRTTSPPEE